MMELRGRFNQKMIKRAKFGDAYFDEMGGFDSIEKDRVTGAVSEFPCVRDMWVAHGTTRMSCAKCTFRSRLVIYARGSCRPHPPR
jgi:hypothetical protein